MKTNKDFLSDLTTYLNASKSKSGMKINVAEITFPENQERYIIFWSPIKKQYVTIDTNKGDKE